VPAQDLLDAFNAAVQAIPQGKIVQAIVLFDEYRGKGLEADEKSLAFRFSLQDTQNTLQDDVVEAVMAAAGDAAKPSTARACVLKRCIFDHSGVRPVPDSFILI
jgi:phenylalanyl-tRNA synthetase beta chain